MNTGTNEFPRGYGPLEVFDFEAIAAAPLAMQLWIGFIILTFLTGSIFVKEQHIARWAVGGIIATVAAGEIVFTAIGLPMLSGAISIWHIVCWSPVLLLLLIHRPFLNPNEGRWYRIWSAVITCVILTSFVFDFRDAAIYINHFNG